MLYLRSAIAALVLLASWTQGSNADVCFGFYELRGGVPYAVEGETWTFDHGSDPHEGWVPEHVFAPPGPDIVRWQTLSDFENDGLPPGAPIIAGDGMIWSGLHENEAEALCFECGLGYGYGRQQIQSPSIPYTGGDVDLEFLHFQDFDGYKMLVIVRSDLIYKFWSDAGGPEEGPVGSWDDPAVYAVTIPGHVFDGSSSLSVEIRFSNRYGGGDEDCTYDSQWGAFGVDNLRLSGGADAFFDFEGDAEGWVTHSVNEDPDLYFETRDLASYGRGYEDWPDCGLEGNVMTLHGPGVFPDNRTDGATSPIIDLTELGTHDFASFVLFMETLEDYPYPNPGLWKEFYFRQYPLSRATGEAPCWSNWTYLRSDAVTTTTQCEVSSVFWEPTVLPDSVQIHVAVRSCSACCPTECEGAEFTPFFDNLEFCVRLPVANVPGVDNPSDFGLRLSSQPVRPSSTVTLAASTDARPESRMDLTVELFDATGRHLAILFDESTAPGDELPLGSWLAEERHGLNSGMYFARFYGARKSETIKVNWAP